MTTASSVVSDTVSPFINMMFPLLISRIPSGEAMYHTVKKAFLATIIGWKAYSEWMPRYGSYPHGLELQIQASHRLQEKRDRQHLVCTRLWQTRRFPTGRHIQCNHRNLTRSYEEEKSDLADTFSAYINNR